MSEMWAAGTNQVESEGKTCLENFSETFGKPKRSAIETTTSRSKKETSAKSFWKRGFLLRARTFELAEERPPKDSLRRMYSF